MVLDAPPCLADDSGDASSECVRVTVSVSLLVSQQRSCKLRTACVVDGVRTGAFEIKKSDVGVGVDVQLLQVH